MRAFGWAIGAVLLVAAQAGAAENRFERALKMLAPPERLEQLCDYTAMTRIRKESANFRPDRAVANATAEPVIRNHTIAAEGRRLPQPRQMVRAVVHLHGDARSLAVVIVSTTRSARRSRKPNGPPTACGSECGAQSSSSSA